MALVILLATVNGELATAFARSGLSAKLGIDGRGRLFISREDFKERKVSRPQVEFDTSPARTSTSPMAQEW
jgi:hypothetical protein